MVNYVTQYGSYKYEDVERTQVKCTVLPGIPCFGNSTFMRDGVPCVKYVDNVLSALFVLHYLPYLYFALLQIRRLSLFDNVTVQYLVGLPGNG